MSKIKGTLLLLIFSITNIFAMRMSPSQIEARKKSVSGIMSKMKKEQTFKKELMDAGWSQDKIRELRQKRNAHGTLVYPVHYSPFQHDTADQKALNDFLIEHYYGKIYAALQTVPVDERSSWTSDFHLLLVIGLDNFKKGGKERFDKGLLKMINSAEDGLELGALGTKYLAFKKVKETTNNFTAIPFIGGTKISPIELFEQIIKPDQQQEMKEIIPHIKIIEKPQLPETLPLSKEDQDKELKEAFDIKEDQINQSMVDLKNVLSQEQALSIIKEELEPGEFFVYQKGTKEGLILSWDDIQKSGVIVNMLGDSDWVTREKLSLGQEKLVFNKDRWQREQSAIPLPCSIDMLEIIFGHSRVEKWDKSSILGELSWEQLENL
ncbi:MAG TPA: hypothetical protein VKU36_02665, partial [Candidatus Babeliales bacterium]|nr:hypothetical protein [Candidatus Babeliales bacterium]